MDKIGKRPDDQTYSSIVWNQAEMLSRLGGDDELFTEIVNEFIRDMEKQIGNLKKFVAHNDQSGIFRQLHNMKGTVSNVNGVAMLESIEWFQSAAAAKEPIDFYRMVCHLESRFAELKAEMLGKP